MNPAISQLEAFITRLDRQRAHMELFAYGPDAPGTRPGAAGADL
jgi:hypothetical protein